MSVEVTKRATKDGVRYSISGLTFGQLFRIKNAMYAEEKKMKEIASELLAHSEPMGKEFEGYAQDAHEVFIAANEGCI